MDIGYNIPRIDSFLITTDIKPRDSRIVGYSDRQKREEERKLLEAARRGEKLLF